jgi:hypothetical protein
LNRYFVPVYVSNEDYGPTGAASPAEKTEYTRIYHETLHAHLSAGTVHVYLLKPDGHVFDSMHVAQAAEPNRLAAMLERATQTLKTPAGKPLVSPVAQSAPPDSAAGSLVLHLTARALTSGSWHEFPAENWIVLDRGQWRKLLPPGPAPVGRSWTIDRELSARLLTYFYPQTENNDLSTNQIEQQSLQARVLSSRGGLVRARIDGRLEMKHAFYPHRPDDNEVEAKVVGFFVFEPATSRIRVLKLVTTGATYGHVPFAVEAHSIKG